MQDLIDITDLDDSAVSLEPANWTCCACTCENKPSFLVCEMCYFERPAPAAPDGRAVQEEGEAIDKWECSTCTFKNEPLLLCCEMCKSTRPCHKLEAAAAQPSKAQSAAASPPTNVTKSLKRPASSRSAAPAPDARKSLKATTSAAPRTMSNPAVQHRDIGKAAAAPAQSENYCSRCSGYFMSAYALGTHECAGSCERIGKPNEPIVLANFITPVEEVALLEF
jgi:Zn-finger in Ran binding protein and others